jgi:hypothetical protein
LLHELTALERRSDRVSACRQVSKDVRAQSPTKAKAAASACQRNFNCTIGNARKVARANKLYSVEKSPAAFNGGAEFTHDDLVRHNFCAELGSQPIRCHQAAQVVPHCWLETMALR